MINKILLIGETDAVREFAVESLAAGGFEVTVAPDVATAHQALTLKTIDLVIADVAVAALLRLQRSAGDLRVLTIGGGEPGKPLENLRSGDATTQSSALVWPFSAIELLAAVWDMDLSRRSFGRLEPAMATGAVCGEV